MIYTFATAAAILLSGCGQLETPDGAIPDWKESSSYFAPTDAAKFETYYKPAVGFVGDPMPFYDPVAEDFKIMYLQDFRPNPPATYHPIWAASTKDAAHYTSLGELIPCGTQDEQDAAIGTGSTVYNPSDRLYYTFYTGNKYLPKDNESPQVVMLATSPDFKTWTKNRTVYIKGEDNGYSKSDFRDPFVFADESGLWHMVVSTTRDGKGRLAEYVSSDLLSWECKGDFMLMIWNRFYECPDIFTMGGWWYLVYSEIDRGIRRVQYFKGKSLEDLKKATAADPMWPDNREGYLDSRGLYAGKTASDGRNRYLWGWCPTRAGQNNAEVGAPPMEPEWGGNLVAHKIIQHEDGSLTLGAIPAIDRKYSKEIEVDVTGWNADGSVEEENGVYRLSSYSHLLFNRLDVCNKLSFKVKAADMKTKFGISVARGSDSEKWYTMIVNPENDGYKRKINFEEEGEKGRGFIVGIDGYFFDTPADDEYDITIYTDNSILVMYINDNVAYTNRIYGMAKNCWSINCYEGSITVSDLKVSHQ